MVWYCCWTTYYFLWNFLLVWATVCLSGRCHMTVLVSPVELRWQRSASTLSDCCCLMLNSYELMLPMNITEYNRLQYWPLKTKGFHVSLIINCKDNCGKSCMYVTIYGAQFWNTDSNLDMGSNCRNSMNCVYLTLKSVFLRMHIS